MSNKITIHGNVGKFILQAGSNNAAAFTAGQESKIEILAELQAICPPAGFSPRPSPHTYRQQIDHQAGQRLLNILSAV